MTVTDANSDPISFILDGNNAVLNTCCSGSHLGDTTASVNCDCSDLSLLNGGAGGTYIVKIIANDVTFDSAPVYFSLTFTSLNYHPEFYDLTTSFTVTTDTNPFSFNVQYRDLNLGDTLTFSYTFLNLLQTHTLVSAMSITFPVSPIYSLGGHNLVFDFTNFVGTVDLKLVVQDDNSSGGFLGIFYSV